jgi:hypothetical protein
MKKEAQREQKGDLAAVAEDANPNVRVTFLA